MFAGSEVLKIGGGE